MLIPRMCIWYGIRKHIKILFYEVILIGHEDIRQNATLLNYLKKLFKIEIGKYFLNLG